MHTLVYSIVVQSNWTKGRLNCPNTSCGCRLGAFDFTDCRGASPVHLVCSKATVPDILTFTTCRHA